jgi:hypothetical protein
LPLVRLTDNGFEPLLATTFETEGLTERGDLQRLLRDSPEILEEGLFILDEEFGNWEESKRRIDLLGLDIDGKLVVIELKRTEEGGHMELQALRYAAMVANMTVEQAVEAHGNYLRRRNIDADARARITEKLHGAGSDEPLMDSTRPRIVLVSADFSKELTTSVLWLNDFGVDIRCVRVKPYRLADSVLVDIEQILPLPEASDYLVKVRQRVEETEAAVSRSRRERTLGTLMRVGLISPGTDIELDRRKLTAGSDQLEEDMFKARFGTELNVRANVIWQHDGQAYSLSGLTERLRDEHGIPLPAGALNGYWYWKPANGTDKTLWEFAEEAGRG